MENDFPFQAEFEDQMRRARAELDLAVDDIYEDSAYCSSLLQELSRSS